MLPEASGVSLFPPCPLADDLPITYISTIQKGMEQKIAVRVCTAVASSLLLLLFHHTNLMGFILEQGIR